MKKHRWLSAAEYVMLVSSGVGSVATAASQQALFAVAPLSALFVLNLLNHRRLEQAAQETTEAAVSKLDQKVSTSLTTLQQQIQAMPSPLHLATLRKDLQNKSQESFNEVRQHIQQLQQDLGQTNWPSIAQDLAHLQEQYAVLADSVSGVQESLSRISANHRSETFEQELNQLKGEISTLQTNLQTLNGDQKLNNYRVLQDQITHLNRRLNKLPAPFDASTLRQDMGALVKAFGEMASRRDLSRLEVQLEKLAQQNEDVEGAVLPLKVVTNILKKQVDTVSNRVKGLEEIVEPANGSIPTANSAIVNSLQATVSSLEEQLKQLPRTADFHHLRAELQSIVANHLGPLQHQLDTVQQQTQDLDQQHRTLRDWVHRLPKLLDTSALHSEVKYLASRVEWAETELHDLQSKVGKSSSYELVFEVQGRGQTYPALEGQVIDTINRPGSGIREQESEADRIRTLRETSQQTNSPMPTSRGPQALIPRQLSSSTPTTPHTSTPYSLGSRAMLEQALQAAEARVVVVYPFPSPNVLDDEMMQRFQVFLERRGCLDIGWGHLGISNDRQPRSIERRRSISRTDNEFLFNRLNQLTELKKQYPDQLRFKVLGTDEYFLVCDRAYAILGTQSLATTSTQFPEAAVGLRTLDANIIQTLMERFDDPVLHNQDAPAYFNRAGARYDLGNRQGAIADYTTVLTITPDDDVALNNRALVYYDLNQKQDALADLDRAIELNPHNFVAFTNRGYIRSEQSDKLGAIEDYTFALHLNPDYAIAYFYRGLARTRLQNKLGAIQDYTEVIRLTPRDASAYFYRGLASAKIGQRMEAMRDLRLAAQLFADQGDSGNYQQTINALKKLQKMMVISDSGRSIVANGTQGRN